MQRKRLLIFSLIFQLFLFACKSTTNIVTHLEALNKEIPLIKMAGWDIKDKIITSSIEDYKLEANINDTLYHLQFTYYKNIKEELLLNHYTVSHFIISYFDRSSEWSYVTEFRKDTLYSYKSHVNSITSKEFIVGKYYYQYIRSELNEAQKEYFIFNKDSLIKIRGNNLPDLPEME